MVISGLDNRVNSYVLVMERMVKHSFRRNRNVLRCNRSKFLNRSIKTGTGLHPDVDIFNDFFFLSESQSKTLSLVKTVT